MTGIEMRQAELVETFAVPEIMVSGATEPIFEADHVRIEYFRFSTVRIDGKPVTTAETQVKLLWTYPAIERLFRQYLPIIEARLPEISRALHVA